MGMGRGRKIQTLIYVLKFYLLPTVIVGEDRYKIIVGESEGQAISWTAFQLLPTVCSPKQAAGSHFGIHTRKHRQHLPHIKVIWQTGAAMQNSTMQHQQLCCSSQAQKLKLSLKKKYVNENQLFDLPPTPKDNIEM